MNTGRRSGVDAYSRLVSDETEKLPAYYLEKYQKEGGSSGTRELQVLKSIQPKIQNPKVQKVLVEMESCP